jgi:hypothetical protein
MVDGAPNLLWGLLRKLSPRPDGVDLHPYRDTSPTFEETVTFLQEDGYAVSVCEWNDSTPKGIKVFQATMDALDITASTFLPWISGPQVDNLPGLVSSRTGKLLARGVALREAYALTGG